MTLNLSHQEMTALEQMADARGMTKSALVRQSIRLFASVTERLDRGEKVFIEHPDGRDKAELMVL